MTDFEQQMLDEKQLQVDLIESGIIRANGMIIQELAAADADDRLTLEKIRFLYNKIGESLGVYDKAVEDLNSWRQHYENKYAEKKEAKTEAKDDNHE